MPLGNNVTKCEASDRNALRVVPRPSYKGARSLLQAEGGDQGRCHWQAGQTPGRATPFSERVQVRRATRCRAHDSQVGVLERGRGAAGVAWPPEDGELVALRSRCVVHVTCAWKQGSSPTQRAETNKGGGRRGCRAQAFGALWGYQNLGVGAACPGTSWYKLAFNSRHAKRETQKQTQTHLTLTALCVNLVGLRDMARVVPPALAGGVTPTSSGIAHNHVARARWGPTKARCDNCDPCILPRHRPLGVRATNGSGARSTEDFDSNAATNLFASSSMGRQLPPFPTPWLRPPVRSPSPPRALQGKRQAYFGAARWHLVARPAPTKAGPRWRRHNQADKRSKRATEQDQTNSPKQTYDHETNQASM